tara:strand:- start:1282 stop:2163 length:882 start_codon:yes stop_codon:yes gene_type:complete
MYSWALIIFCFILFNCSGSDIKVDNKRINQSTNIAIYECDSDSLILSQSAKDALIDAGLTKCMMPFGVLIGSDKNIPDSFVLLAGQILSEMLDQNMDREVDDSLILDYVQNWQVAWLAMPSDPEIWENDQLPVLQGILGYDIIIPEWWMGSSGLSQPNEHAKSVMVEEITHFLTQFGYSAAYPEQFGVTNWSSVIAKETLLAQCKWWQHPENDCPNSPSQVNGDCSSPDCDVVEFYHQVLILRAGMMPEWFGVGFPDSKEILEGLLSDEIKNIMDSPIYHQLKEPISFQYPIP